jgi:hypothetical protein
MAQEPCAPTPGPSMGESDAAAPRGGESDASRNEPDRPPRSTDGDRYACAERRAGLLAGLGTEAGAALAELARLDLEAGRPSLSVLLYTVAESLGDAVSEGLAHARARAGDPCGVMVPAPRSPAPLRREYFGDSARRPALTGG